MPAAPPNLFARMPGNFNEPYNSLGPVRMGNGGGGVEGRTSKRTIQSGGGERVRVQTLPPRAK